MVSKWSSLSIVPTNVFVRRKRNSNTRIFKWEKIRFIKNVSAKSLQSCPALCDPMDCSPPGSSVWGFSRQEYWSGLPCLLQGIFLTQGSNPCLLHLLHWQADRFFTTSATWEALQKNISLLISSFWCLNNFWWSYEFYFIIIYRLFFLLFLWK